MLKTDMRKECYKSKGRCDFVVGRMSEALQEYMESSDEKSSAESLLRLSRS